MRRRRRNTTDETLNAHPPTIRLFFRPGIRQKHT